MSETPHHQIGEVENGHRWTGAAWEPVSDPAPEPAPDAAPTADAAIEPAVEPAIEPAIEPAVEPIAAPVADATAGPVSPPITSAAPADDPAAYWAPGATSGAGVAAPTSAARAAAPLFLIGVAVAVAVSIAGIVVVNSRGGGILWWGGYFVTFALWRNAKAKYDAAGRASGETMSAGTKALAALGVVLAIGSAAAFGLTYLHVKSAPPLAATVGSCWQEKDGKAFLVECDSADATYKAVGTAATQNDCPQEAIASVETDTPGTLLCLANK